MIVHSSPIQQHLQPKCTSLYSKVSITYMQVQRSIMRMNNNGSKSSLKVKLLQGSPPVVKTTEVIDA